MDLFPLSPGRRCNPKRTTATTFMYIIGNFSSFERLPLDTLNTENLDFSVKFYHSNIGTIHEM